jgi:glycosyltransferase involved in cell wall biosynthesis
VTPDQPARTVNTSVVFCTFNRLEYLSRIVQSLAEHKEVYEAIPRIYVVNQGDKFELRDLVGEASEDFLSRVELIELDENRGVGGALAIAYCWARDKGYDIAVSVDADGQMDPDEMAELIRPIAEGRADYAKGNRLAETKSWRDIPRIRLFGNAVLSVATKVASGYWGIADSQSGYTAAGRYALEHIDWESMYPRYGRPNDVLVLANVAECRVADVPVTPVYGVGESSHMSILKVVFGISRLLFRRFWWRMFHRYVLRDFHPLVFFYLFAIVASLFAIGLTGRLLWLWAEQGHVPPMTALALAFFAISALNSTFFAFWMDMEANRDLVVRVDGRRLARASTTAAGVVTRLEPPTSPQQSRRAEAEP